MSNNEKKIIEYCIERLQQIYNKQRDLEEVRKIITLLNGLGNGQIS